MEETTSSSPRFEHHCYKTCPEKTYSEELECKACDTNCGNCDQNECYWCEEGFFLLGGSCVRECGPGFYGDQGTGECEPCHPSCEACTGVGDDECSRCGEGQQLRHGTCVWPANNQVEGKFWNERKTVQRNESGVKLERVSQVSGRLQPERVSVEHGNSGSGQANSLSLLYVDIFVYRGAYLLEHACVSSCPEGTWPSVKSGSCENCTEDCASCSGADLCKKCQSQPERPLFLYQGRCYSSCPEGFYAEDSICERCSSPCQTCVGNATHCHSCEGGLVLDQGVCLKACPERHVAVEGVCKPCPEMCQECIHEKTCKECMPGFFLHKDMCHQSCPQHFYQDLHQCIPCHEDCLECSGPKEDDCELCADRFTVLYNGLCLNECPSGTYYEEKTKDCRDCHESCHSCSSYSVCTSCQEGLRLNSHGACVAHKECAPIEYWDETAHRCKPCHHKCFHCTGPAEDQCRTCRGDNLLLSFLDAMIRLNTSPEELHLKKELEWREERDKEKDKEKIRKYTTCVQDCPEGYYARDSHLCASCHISCRTCDGSHSTQCRSCRPGWFQLENECLLQCREGYYAEISTGQCKRCHKSCKACRGPQPTDCLSCDTYFFLLASKGECYRTCPEHYYAEENTWTCERCHPTCKKCKGKGGSDCLSCVWNYHLMGGICNSDCLVGKYRVGEGEKFNCEKCHESCMECKGPGTKNCTMCPASLLLHMDDGRCLHCCNTSSPSNTQECCDCQESMDECILRRSEPGSAAERSKTALLITSSVMLLLLLGAAVFVWRKSRGRVQPVQKAGYEKLADPARSYSSYKSSYGEGTSFEEDQMIEYRDQDYDEDDNDDIVYMSQDGTVYRKFKYGLLEDEEEDELEYDDESYSFQ
uniref:proprotein convertase subtilisin/kexin type 5-like n=1 Tax=Ictidomys tridecemlineatus TaxID=43179 RepID=UPI001A9F53DB|nr:proprotein convertase subtilisin/kexin type 5-like [Ictidomys tridecemlineatus]